MRAHRDRFPSRGRAIVLLAGSLGACSVAMREPPYLVPPGGDIDCSDGRAAPIADSVGAIVSLGLGLAAGILVGSSDAHPGADSGHGLLAASIPAAIYTVSAIHGYGVASRCNAARDKARAEQRHSTLLGSYSR